VLGLGALYFFLVFFNIAANFLVNTIGFAIPAYYSLDALFTTSSTDDTQVSLSGRLLTARDTNFAQWLTVRFVHGDTR